MVALREPAAQPAIPHLSALHRALEALAGAEMYEAASAAAITNGMHVHEELLVRGVSHAEYAEAVATWLSIECIRSPDRIETIEARTEPGAVPREVVARIDGADHHIIDATCLPPDAIARHVARLTQLQCRPCLAPKSIVDIIDEQTHARPRLDEAVNGMKRRMPSRSAASGWRRHQVLTPIVCLGLVLGGLMVLPEATLTATGLLMGVPFLCVTVLRLQAFREVLMSRRRRARRRTPLLPAELPRYSVLVPLFRETDVLPDLLAALQDLDYPASKLEIMLLIEAADLPMQTALLGHVLPANFRVLVVPDSLPRTKPKALNYGIQFAHGDLIVVYDAEDRPHPQQLKAAAEVFARAPAHLACVQAQLNTYNPDASWFTRQFTIEYSALFDAVLPALERLALPVPLGGTSNHFRRRDLEAVGAWDPFNVTEDADLGIRLARDGRSTRIVPSTTWEEAPTTFRVWLPQRTRWLKGWMQTWLVHTREPGALRADLGVISWIGVHAVMGGLVVSALVQPFFLALLAYQIWMGTLLETADNLIVTGLVWISLGNLAAGYAVSILIGILSVAQRGRFWLASAALAMPLYWLLISLAAYRALYQLIRAPFVWEKTPHGAAKGPRARKR